MCVNMCKQVSKNVVGLIVLLVGFYVLYIISLISKGNSKLQLSTILCGYFLNHKTNGTVLQSLSVTHMSHTYIHSCTNAPINTYIQTDRVY